MVLVLQGGGALGFYQAGVYLGQLDPLSGVILHEAKDLMALAAEWRIRLLATTRRRPRSTGTAGQSHPGPLCAIRRRHLRSST